MNEMSGMKDGSEFPTIIVAAFQGPVAAFIALSWVKLEQSSLLSQAVKGNDEQWTTQDTCRLFQSRVLYLPPAYV